MWLGGEGQVEQIILIVTKQILTLSRWSHPVTLYNPVHRAADVCGLDLLEKNKNKKKKKPQ